jgi:hypothetical protein
VDSLTAADIKDFNSLAVISFTFSVFIFFINQFKVVTSSHPRRVWASNFFFTIFASSPPITVRVHFCWNLRGFRLCSIEYSDALPHHRYSSVIYLRDTFCTPYLFNIFIVQPFWGIIIVCCSIYTGSLSSCPLK